MAKRSPIVAYLTSHVHVLIKTDIARELFMIPERTVASVKVEDGPEPVFHVSWLADLYEGKLFAYEGMFYAVKMSTRIDNRHTEMRTYRVTATPTGIIHNSDETTPLATPQDKFILTAGDIANYPQGPDIETTIGRFMANAIFFVYPYQDKIAYLNEEFTTDKMEERIGERLMLGELSVLDTRDKYANAVSLWGQSNEILCPGISEKTLVIPDSIRKLREKLIADNREALDRGDVTIMTEIEQTLIKAYKEHLKGDPSLHFLLKSKYFNVAFKKLLLTHGIVEVFGQPGKFRFIEQPLADGWKLKDFPDIFNETRSGSYARAIETADGGVVAKTILRVFQDTQLRIADCGTHHGERVKNDPALLRDFVWSYAILKDGSTRLITKDNLSDFSGSEIAVRTPGYCAEPDGFCAKCFGKTFEALEQKAFAPIANEVGRQQLVNSLKAMHGVSRSTTDISNLNKYLAK